MVNVDPTKFSTTADTFDGLSQQALNYAIAARGSLSGYGGMAGTDPGGESFSEAYDQMATAALQVLYDIAVATRGLDRAIMATGGTHAQANANAEGIVYDAASAFVLRAEIAETTVAAPPSAFGGRPDTMVQGLDSAAMWVWDQILNLVGTLFPDGDPEKLEEAGSAWQTILGDISSLRTDIRLGDNTLIGMESAEISAIQTKVTEFADGLTTFLSSDEGIGAIDDICREYAQTIRDTLEETRQMIAQLVIEIVATAGISFALSFVTFGAAGAVGGGVIAARIGVIATRIASLVSKCVGTATRLAVRLRAIVAGMRAAGAAFPKLTRVGIELVAGTSATVLAETVQGGEANYGAAFLSGLAGGGVTSAITAPFGAHGSKFLVQALGNGSGGAAGSVVDLGVRGEEISVQAVAMSAGLGVAMSARLPSRRTPTSAGGTDLGSTPVAPPIARIPGRTTPTASNPGGRSSLPDSDGNAPSGAGSGVTGSSVDGGGNARPDYDGPAGQGGDVSGSGGDGGGASSNHGEAPAEQEIVVTSTGDGSTTPESPSPVADAPTPVADAPAPNPVADAPTPVADAPTPVADAPTPVADADAPTPAADAPSTPADNVSTSPDTATDAGGQSRGDDSPATDAPSSGADAPSATDADASPSSNGSDAPSSDGDTTTPHGPDATDGSNNVDGADGSNSADGGSTDSPAANADDAVPTTDAADGSSTDAADAPPVKADDGSADASPADQSASGTSPNAKIQTLFDADGSPRTFEQWDAATKGDSNASLNTRKGEFGELHAQNYMESQGWTRIDDGADGSKNPNSPGLDGVYSRPGADGKTEYAVIEAKYNTAGMGKTLDGRQMSQGWIHGDATGRSRLEAALRGNRDAFLRIDGMPRSELQSGLVRVTPEGEVRVQALGADGRVDSGSKVPFEAGGSGSTPATAGGDSADGHAAPGTTQTTDPAAGGPTADVTRAPFSSAATGHGGESSPVPSSAATPASDPLTPNGAGQASGSPGSGDGVNPGKFGDGGVADAGDPGSGDGGVADGGDSGSGDGAGDASDLDSGAGDGAGDAGDGGDGDGKNAAPGNPPYNPAELQDLTPRQQEIIAGNAASGDGWHRYDMGDPAARAELEAEIAAYNSPRADPGELNLKYGPQIDRPVGGGAAWVGFDGQPYGHQGFGGPEYSVIDNPGGADHGRSPEWDRHYVDREVDGNPNVMHYSPNYGAVLDTRVRFTSLDAFQREFGNLRIDRLGSPSGSFMGLGGGTFNDRALPPGQRTTEDYRSVTLVNNPVLPAGHTIEIGLIADAYGRDGGGLQLAVFDQHGDSVSLDELTSLFTMSAPWV